MPPVALLVTHFWQRRRALLWLESLHPKQSLARVRILSRPGAARNERRTPFAKEPSTKTRKRDKEF